LYTKSYDPAVGASTAGVNRAADPATATSPYVWSAE
jgi:hypothetical protein